MEILTNKVSVLNDIVAFGSTCTVHVDTENKSLGERGKAGIIIGRALRQRDTRCTSPRKRWLW